MSTTKKVAGTKSADVTKKTSLISEKSKATKVSTPKVVTTKKPATAKKVSASTKAIATKTTATKTATSKLAATKVATKKVAAKTTIAKSAKAVASKSTEKTKIKPPVKKSVASTKTATAKSDSTKTTTTKTAAITKPVAKKTATKTTTTKKSAKSTTSGQVKKKVVNHSAGNESESSPLSRRDKIISLKAQSEKLSEKASQLLIDEVLKSIDAKDIKWFNIKNIFNYADWVVIATVTSVRQSKAIAEEFIKLSKNKKVPLIGVEGEITGEWVLVDMGDIVLHVMLPEERTRVDLDGFLSASKQK